LCRAPLKRGRPLSRGHHQGSSGWFSYRASPMWLFIAVLIHIVEPVNSVFGQPVEISRAGFASAEVRGWPF
jgi:hypothetical protein